MPGALEDDVADAGPHVPAAIAALLAPPGSLERRHILERVAREAGGGASSLGALRLAFSPDPAQLAAIAGVGAHSPWRWLGWPEWALRRTAAYLRARVDARGAMSSVGADLRAWADGG
ncbi:hypothetical protein GRI40_11140 [Altererythrobacter aerius]|uniref:Uncharacterized protein n=1 Tax=Tsuneonella aeria TaxID=1837929 RepID=A0A6I4TEM7_9SPHN|nr:hypothetical protein [Tsuneonella aeria]MXO75771.1 hypothetical protein [Tsuneonella aeria]